MKKVSFAGRHRWDSYFWLVFLAAGWLAIGMGFGRPIRLRFDGMADYPAPLILVIHVFAYFGWMVLISLQALLVGRRQIGLHRQFGIAGMAIAVFVTFSGILAEVYSQRFYALRDPENVRFFVVPAIATIGFGAMALLAFARRRDPAEHKRLIYLATCAVLQGPYSRWWDDPILEALGSGFAGTFVSLFAGIDLWLFAAVAYDLATRGQVHRVYRYGVPFLVGLQLIAIVIWFSDWWPPLGRSMLGLQAVAT